MTSTDIRVGDKVRHRETGKVGRVAALVQVRGGFGDSPWLTDEQIVRFDMASVSRQGMQRSGLEGTADLAKRAADRA